METTINFPAFTFLLNCLPADPVARDAMQGEEGELEVVCGARCFFAAPPIHSFFVRSLGQRRRAEGGGGRTEGAQVELGQVVDGLR